MHVRRVIIRFVILACVALAAAAYLSGRTPVGGDATRQPADASPVPDIATVKVFFGNSLLDPEVSCVKVFPVERQVDPSLGIEGAALEEMLKGPSAAESEAGFGTSLNPGVTLTGLVIEAGVARAEFDPTLDRRVGGSCRVSAIRAQIEQTLLQFDAVKSVVISIDGRTEDILQP